jgi:hypothetical protein
MNCKRFGRKRSWPNFKLVSSTRVEGLKTTTKHLSQDSRSPCQDFNPEPAEYEAGMLAAQPLCSVLYSDDEV